MENQVFYYAGFWRRFVAYIIDELIVGAASMIVLLPLYLIFGVGVYAIDNFDQYGHYSTVNMFSQYSHNDEWTVAFIIALVTFGLIVGGITIVIQWLYYALMESSAKQATLGKLAIGLKVTDTSGNRITFGRASGRYFGKIISGLIFNIGYIMAAFTERKQALHDMMANCLVILDRPNYQQYAGGINENNQSSTSA